MILTSGLIKIFQERLDIGRKNAVWRVGVFVLLSICFVATVFVSLCKFIIGWHIILPMVVLFLLFKVQKRCVYRWGGNRTVYKNVWF